MGHNYLHFLVICLLPIAILATQCGPNEEYLSQGQNCSTCDTYKTCACPVLQKYGCYCKNGYTRNPSGICVSFDDCEEAVCKAKDANSSYVKCGYPDYRRTCDDIEPYMPNTVTPCQPYCNCLDSFVYDAANKICVRPVDCPDKCPPNEKLVQCMPKRVAYCKNTTAEPNRVCRLGCDCEKGYVKRTPDFRSPCIKIEECPVCPKNEEYLENGDDCTCFDCNNDVVCQRNYTAKCYCEKGLYRIANGSCVPSDICRDHECKLYDIYSYYNPNATHKDCRKTCQNPDGINPCPQKPQPACVCIPGYVENENGTCVPEKPCRDANCKKNDPNSEYSDCSTPKSCRGTCKNPDGVNPCPEKCAPGCQCQKGYVEDDSGKCVPIRPCQENNCKKVDPNTEYSDCVPAPECRKTCQNPNGTNPCPKPCKPGCTCRSGYVLHSNGTCVPERTCKEEACKNQDQMSEYNDCAVDKRCRKTCRKPEGVSPCPYPCSPDCICIDGYVKADNGSCVPIRPCQEQVCKDQDPNSEYSDCAPDESCTPSCKNINGTNPCPVKCKPGCVCSKGYVRHSNGTCVPVRKCKEDDCKNKDQMSEYSDCAPAKKCRQTCKNPDGISPCPDPCSPDCVCIDGYVEADNGTCVPKRPCQEQNCKKEDPNSEYSDCAPDESCRPSCRNINGTNPCPVKCKPGCVCSKGYVRHANGTCVPVRKCKEEECKDKDKMSEYSDCAPAKKCRQTCKNPDGISPCPDPCSPDCVCIDGYVEADNGTCVPKRPCQEQNCKKEDPNSEFSDCAPNEKCRPSCSNINGTNPCPVKCKPGCVCSKGYVRHANGTCVPIRKCKEEECKNKDQMSEYSDCAPAKKCRQTCKNPDGISPCPEPCSPDCVCVNNYVEADNGTCVPKRPCQEENCKKQDPNSEYSDCVRAECRPTCKNINGTSPCPGKCFSGCICSKGYVKHDNGTCVPIRTCKEEECKNKDQMSEYSDCAPDKSCRETCKNPDGIKPCPKPCSPDCVCVDGYVEDDKGKCVPKGPCQQDNCKKEDPNSSYSPCAPPEACRPCCDNINGTNPCPVKCKPGCVCNEGYVRHSNGTCVPIRTCKEEACKNQDKMSEYSDCAPAKKCRKTCKNPEGISPCPERCSPDCVCIDGYVEDDQGKCVPIKPCQEQNCKKEDPNSEYSDCAPNEKCRPSCRNINGTNPCPVKCKPGCVCSKGYVRHDNGTCVPVRKCKEEECKNKDKMSEYSDCAPAKKCRKTCKNPDGISPCPDPCSPDCVCIDGYVENDNGTCVPIRPCQEENCKKEDPNSEYSDCAPNEKCRPSCRNINGTNPCPVKCKPGCVCSKGYVRHDNGTCVPVRKCKEEECKNKDQMSEYSDCAPAKKCRKTCKNPDGISPCPEPCSPDCVCIDGYVEDDQGKCVPKRPCQEDNCKKEDPNSEFSDCAPSEKCRPSCRNINGTNPCPVKCGPGCVCRKGYVRHDNGTCVPIRVCKEEECKNKDKMSEYSDCAPAKKCRKTCKNPDGISPCPEKCSPDCVCIDGYVEADNGTCVPKRPCQEDNCKKEDPNSEYSDCAPDESCRPSCSNINPPPPGPGQCRPGCVCRKGYVRHRNGTCVPIRVCKEEECKEKDKMSEYSDCAPDKSCRETCKNPDGIKPCPKPCSPDCVCVDGYVEDDKGKCVPKRPCQEQNCKKEDPNSEYSDCAPNEKCRPSCRNINGTNPCPVKCKPGCVCSKGYVRHDNGTCVPIRKCKEEECKNKDQMSEYSDCAPAKKCRQTCKNPDGIKECPEPCSPDCVCIDGYVEDDQGKCVPKRPCQEENCKKEDPNSEFSDCAPSEKCRPSCRNINGTNPCPVKCRPGCVCSKGYVRHDNGTCVPIRTCKEEECKNKDKMSEYSDCAPAKKCRQTCKNPDGISPCPEKCSPDCVCIDGYVEDDEGKCVPKRPCQEENCKKEDPNSEYSDCAPNEKCRPSCRNINGTNPCPVKCRPGCVCRKGYVRHDNGTCVPIRVCKEEECKNKDQMSEYSDCAPAKKCRKTCKNPDGISPCPEPCSPDCVCIDGYVEDDKGNCVPKRPCQEENCKKEDPNSEYSDCAPSEKCRPSCRNINGTNPCPEKCKPGCVCSKGYVRHGNGTCVPVRVCKEEECKNKDKMSEYSDCAPAKKCRETCKDPDGTSPCPIPCSPDCVCIKGYVEDDNGKCVPKEPCQDANCKKKDPNSEYTDCAPPKKCRASCKNPKGVTPCLEKCSPGCVCKKGYVEHDNGTCVPIAVCKDEECKRNDSNSEYTECGKEYSCRPTCKKPNGTEICVAMCVSSCSCKKGYVYADENNRTCIAIADCRDPCTDADENSETSNCAPAKECRPTCQDPNPKGPCDKKCRKDCVCKKGYTYDEICKKCVKDCPGCGPNEKLVKCLNPCQRSCANRYRKPCPESGCRYGCECKDGYIRQTDAPDSPCIKEKECPRCGKNEEYTASGTDCHTCDNCNNTKCEYIIAPRCRCKPGYVRDKHNRCIKPEDCPKVDKDCGENEMASNCRHIEEPTCSNIIDRKRGIICSPTKVCICKEGYVRSKPDGPCIPVCQCKYPKCPKNSYLNKEGNPECKKTCSNQFKSELCKEVPPSPFCQCESNYLYCEKSKCCVPAKNCRIEKECKCGKNEELKVCRPLCETTYENYAERNCSDIICEKPTCVCKRNHIRRKGECVHIKSCEIEGCPEDATFHSCGQPACRANCRNPEGGDFCGSVCHPTCECKKGYYYDSVTNTCVRKDECTICPVGERSVECVTIDQPSCNDPDRKPKSKKPCTRGCECIKGYIRETDDPKSRCIKKENCKVCCENEELRNSGTDCQTCDNHYYVKCAVLNVTRCYCKPGHVRDKNNKCVPIASCQGKKQQCGENEEPQTCRPATEPKCESFSTTQCRKVVCDLPTCVCKEGYIRTKGVCVPIDKCGCKCGPNSVLVRCGNPETRPTCQNPMEKKASQSGCQPYCKCVEGYIFNEETDSCIPIDTCPKPCKKNEKAVKCVNLCQPSCVERNRPPCYPKKCQPGCECLPGYIRLTNDINSPCVLNCSCPDCGKNEEYLTEGYDCANCDNYWFVRCPLIKIAKCYCKPGYVRDKSNKCIDPKECKSVIKNCGDNEEIAECYNACEPTCQNPDRKPCTPKVPYPGCVCKKGYIRSGENGQCIRKENCPEKCHVKCPAGEEPNCDEDSACQPTCDNPDGSDCESCKCNPKCECPKGYVRVTHNGKCVPRTDCEDALNEKCDREVENSYYNPKCGGFCQCHCKKDKCSEKCKPGCTCKPGYHYDGSKCVEKGECK